MISRERLDDLAIPAGIRDGILAPGFDVSRPALTAAQEFAGKRRPLLVLAGPTQVGKSTAAAFGAALMRTPGREVVYLNPCNEGDEGAIREMNGAYYVRTRAELGGAPMPGQWVHARQFFVHVFDPDFWDHASRARVLVIDDLGLEPQRPDVRDLVIGLLVGRYDDGRPTIVTTNLTASDFRAAYCQGAGQRLVARLTGGAWVQIGASQGAQHADA